MHHQAPESCCPQMAMFTSSCDPRGATGTLWATALSSVKSKTVAHPSESVVKINSNNSHKEFIVPCMRTHSKDTERLGEGACMGELMRKH